MLSVAIDTSPTNSSEKLSARRYEPYIKYMGSKAKILDFVTSGINEVYDGGAICDLFSGSACLAGALRDQAPFLVNDIQAYSAILADAYLNAWKRSDTPTAEALISSAEAIVFETAKTLPKNLGYESITSLEQFTELESRNKALIDASFKHPYHLFVKFYSGTWWSSYQCLWIDALRQVAETYRGHPVCSVILASLMHAASYSSQGTGHFAQYRDAKTASSLKDITIYRQRSVKDYFVRKYEKALAALSPAPSLFVHEITSQDYHERLSALPENTTIYADPPYCFVHYSRFYHALETLVCYDYPELQHIRGTVVKGRYRQERHQSPFCIKSQVTEAFRDMFEATSKSRSNLVLSYSDTGMVTLDELDAVARFTMGSDYTIELLTQDYKHMTMGRRNDRSRDVKECLVLFKKK